MHRSSEGRCTTVSKKSQKLKQKSNQIRERLETISIFHQTWLVHLSTSIMVETKRRNLNVQACRSTRLSVTALLVFVGAVHPRRVLRRQRAAWRDPSNGGFLSPWSISQNVVRTILRDTQVIAWFRSIIMSGKAGECLLNDILNAALLLFIPWLENAVNL